MKMTKLFGIAVWQAVLGGILFFSLSSGEALAATYYVAPGGSDSNVGTITAPFKSIQKAANAVAAGDTVIVRAGRYESFKLINKNGTSSAWITFRAYAGETPVIDSYQDVIDHGTYNAYGIGILINGGSYIVIDGFEVTSSIPYANSTVYSEYSQGAMQTGIGAWSYDVPATPVQPSYYKLTNNHIHGMGLTGIFTAYRSHHFTIANNHVHDNGWSKRGHGLYIGGADHWVTGNNTHDNYGLGMQAYGEGAGNTPSRDLIEGNIIYNNGTADYGKGYNDVESPTSPCCTANPKSLCTGTHSCGWHPGQTDGLYVNGTSHTIRNNVVFDNLGWGIRIDTVLTTLNNNTTFNNGINGLYVYYDTYWGQAASSIGVWNNIAYGNQGGSGYPGEYYFGSGIDARNNLLGADPKFADATAGDFHLLGKSPAIDAGLAVSGRTVDAEGNAIVGTPDIGAYEYQGTPVTVTQTSVLQNAGFESGTNPWVFYTNGGGTFAADAAGPDSAHAGHIKITGAGTNVQFYQAGLALKPNTLYRLNFKAYSNTGHNLSVSLQKHGSPYTNYGLANSMVNLTNSWKKYTIQFTTSGFVSTVSDGRLMFWLAPYAAAGDEYFIDHVALAAAPADTTAPSVPSGLTASAVSSSQINLTWTASTDNVGVAGYKVYRGGSMIATTTRRRYSDTRLSALTAYRYRISAFDAAGNLSAQSVSVSATAQAGPNTTATSASAGLSAAAASFAAQSDMDGVN